MARDLFPDERTERVELVTVDDEIPEGTHCVVSDRPLDEERYAVRLGGDDEFVAAIAPDRARWLAEESGVTKPSRTKISHKSVKIDELHFADTPLEEVCVVCEDSLDGKLAVTADKDGGKPFLHPECSHLFMEALRRVYPLPHEAIEYSIHSISGDSTIVLTDTAVGICPVRQESVDFGDVVVELRCGRVSVPISIGCVDELAGCLRNRSAANNTLVNNIGYHPEHPEDADFRAGDCVTCGDPVSHEQPYLGTRRVHLLEGDDEWRAVAHGSCIDDFADALETVWEYGDEFLAECV